MTASNCNYTCPGDTKQTCGGYGFLQAFQLNSVPTSVPVPTATDQALATRTTVVLDFGPTPFEGVEVYTSTAGKSSTSSAPPLQTVSRDQGSTSFDSVADSDIRPLDRVPDQPP